MRSVTLHKNILRINIFLKMSCFTTAAVQQRKQLVDAAWCGTFLSGLISMSVFDILQIPSGSVHICSD